MLNSTLHESCKVVKETPAVLALLLDYLQHTDAFVSTMDLRCGLTLDNITYLCRSTEHYLQTCVALSGVATRYCHRLVNGLPVSYFMWTGQMRKVTDEDEERATAAAILLHEVTARASGAKSSIRARTRHGTAPGSGSVTPVKSRSRRTSGVSTPVRHGHGLGHGPGLGGGFGMGLSLDEDADPDAAPVAVTLIIICPPKRHGDGDDDDEEGQGEAKQEATAATVDLDTAPSSRPDTAGSALNSIGPELASAGGSPRSVPPRTPQSPNTGLRSSAASPTPTERGWCGAAIVAHTAVTEAAAGGRDISRAYIPTSTASAAFRAAMTRNGGMGAARVLSAGYIITRRHAEKETAVVPDDDIGTPSPKKNRPAAVAQAEASGPILSLLDSASEVEDTITKLRKFERHHGDLVAGRASALGGAVSVSFADAERADVVSSFIAVTPAPSVLADGLARGEEAVAAAKRNAHEAALRAASTETDVDKAASRAAANAVAVAVESATNAETAAIAASAVTLHLYAHSMVRILQFYKTHGGVEDVPQSFFAEKKHAGRFQYR